jgi:hypothetical protein
VLAAFVLAILLAVGITPFLWLANFLYFDLVLVLDSGITSLIPWIKGPLSIGVLAFGGYIAAARVTNGRKWLAAGLVSGASLIAVFAILAATVVQILPPERSTLALILLTPLWLIGPFAGVVAYDRLSWPLPIRWKDWAWPLLAAVCFPFGASLIAVGFMTLMLWEARPHADSPAPGLFAQAGAIGQAWPAYLIILAGLLACGVYLLRHKTSGRGLSGRLRAKWTYVGLVLALFLAYGFWNRHVENRVSLEGLVAGNFFLDMMQPHPQQSAEAAEASRELLTLGHQLTCPVGIQDALDQVGVPGMERRSAATTWIAEQEDRLLLLQHILLPERQPGWLSLSDYPDEDALDGLLTVLSARGRFLVHERRTLDAISLIDQRRALARGIGKHTLSRWWRSLFCEKQILDDVRDLLGWYDLSIGEVEQLAAFLHEWSDNQWLDFDSWKAAACDTLPRQSIEQSFYALRNQSGVRGYLAGQFASKQAILHKAADYRDEWLSKASRETFEEIRDALSGRAYELMHPTSNPFIRPWSGELSIVLDGQALRLATGYAGQPGISVREQQARLNLLCLYARAYLLLRTSEDRGSESLRDRLIANGVPHDPFSNRPLCMTANATELVLYSLGQNEMDNGGTGYFSPLEQDRSGNEHDDSDDIVLKLPTQAIVGSHASGGRSLYRRPSTTTSHSQ